MSAAERFAALHRPGRPFVLPNAWDLGSALAFEAAGFPAVGTTSFGVTSAAGLPDGVGAGRDTTVALGRVLATRLGVPVTVDLEGGYADDPAEVAALVRGLAAAGVAGVNLEDGRADGTLRPVEQHAAIVAAAAAAAPGLWVNARTDGYWLGRPDPLPETLHRVAAYREAGASGVFVPRLAAAGDLARVVAAAGVPVNVLWLPGMSLADVAAAGGARVSTGSAPYRAALAEAVTTARLADLT